MIEVWGIVILALGYVGVLFAIAWLGDRKLGSKAGGGGRPFIFAASLAVYCTSWTFFGSVGLAASTGYDFLPVYIGPILMFVFGWRLLLRIVKLAKSQNITSVADFLAARYGKSQAVAAIVTLLAVAGTVPYIALQLKAAAISVDILLGPGALSRLALPTDTALPIALVMAIFAVLFGTRHIDATEHQQGLVLAVVAESVVKLAAFLMVGLFVVFSFYGGFSQFAERAGESIKIKAVFDSGFNGSTWLAIMFLSFVCIILLPRQFHMTVVENNSENEIRRARWLFPVYLVLINLFVIPIAAAGIMQLPKASVDADFYVLALPMAAGSKLFTVLAFIGGLSAATAMVIVDSIALAIMVCNGLVVPLLLRRRFDGSAAQDDMATLLLRIRRVAIFAVIMAGYLFYRTLGAAHGLASIGLLSFSAIAQLAPAFFGGLIWKNATARGAIAGIISGFVMWSYTLLLPWVIKAGWISNDIMLDGPLGLTFLRPQELFYLQFSPLAHGVLWSLGANVIAYVSVSLLRPPEPVERLQAHAFVQDDDPPAHAPAPVFRLWRSSIMVSDLQATVARYLGPERAARSFSEHADSQGQELPPDAKADIGLLRFTEHLLASAIGAASSRLVLSLLLRRGDVGSSSDLRLLDDASEALQYNRDLLQSALDQVRHGLSVFDKDMRLICWNRQFRELLELPAVLGRVGMPLEKILSNWAQRADPGEGTVNDLIENRFAKLTLTHETFQERFGGGRRILEIRTSPIPQGGIVTTYSDITERVAAANALARVNETLEGRVRKRTAELMSVNEALGVAKAKADEANLDKTRFLAAASHDVLQPLNAARLYTTSLVERSLAPGDARLAGNINASLEAVEEILSALIDISRLDAGRLEPEYSVFKLNNVFEQLQVEFEPMAKEKGLRLKFVNTGTWVHSDRRLLRRLLQNFISNAIKYTPSGKVLVGCRQRGTDVSVQVIDTGPGIPAGQHDEVFKEFHRLEATAVKARGLGLGLSIVERIGRVLGAAIELRSSSGRGAAFGVLLPCRAPLAVRPASVMSTGFGGQITGTVALCVDNEPAVLDGMEALLQGWGCEVIKADGAKTAVRLLNRGNIQPDIVLVDYHLDDGATGLEAIGILRNAVHMDLPAVVITADHSPEVQRELRQREIALLRKPVKAAALRALMTQYALRRAAAAE